MQIMIDGPFLNFLSYQTNFIGPSECHSKSEYHCKSKCLFIYLLGELVQLAIQLSKYAQTKKSKLKKQIGGK